MMTKAERANAYMMEKYGAKMEAPSTCSQSTIDKRDSFIEGLEEGKKMCIEKIKARYCSTCKTPDYCYDCVYGQLLDLINED